MSIEIWNVPENLAEHFLVGIEKPITPLLDLFEFCGIGIVPVSNAVELLRYGLAIAGTHDLAQILALSFQSAI